MSTVFAMIASTCDRCRRSACVTPAELACVTQRSLGEGAGWGGVADVDGCRRPRDSSASLRAWFVGWCGGARRVVDRGTGARRRDRRARGAPVTEAWTRDDRRDAHVQQGIGSTPTPTHARTRGGGEVCARRAGAAGERGGSATQCCGERGGAADRASRTSDVGGCRSRAKPALARTAISAQSTRADRASRGGRAGVSGTTAMPRSRCRHGGQQPARCHGKVTGRSTTTSGWEDVHAPDRAPLAGTRADGPEHVAARRDGPLDG